MCGASLRHHTLVEFVLSLSGHLLMVLKLSRLNCLYTLYIAKGLLAAFLIEHLALLSSRLLEQWHFGECLYDDLVLDSALLAFGELPPAMLLLLSYVVLLLDAFVVGDEVDG